MFKSEYWQHHSQIFTAFPELCCSSGWSLNRSLLWKWNEFAAPRQRMGQCSREGNGQGWRTPPCGACGWPGCFWKPVVLAHLHSIELASSTFTFMKMEVCQSVIVSLFLQILLTSWSYYCEELILHTKEYFYDSVHSWEGILVLYGSECSVTQFLKNVAQTMTKRH